MSLFVARGITQITWRPNYTLVLESVDGLTLDADGAPHTLIATLTNTTTGAAVPNKKLLLTTSPAGEVGFGKVKITDSTGRVTFSVSDTNNESVIYTCSLLPERVIQDSITIQWGSGDFWGWAGSVLAVSNFGIDSASIAFNIVDSTFNPIVGVVVTMKTTPPGMVNDGFVFDPTDAGGNTNTTSFTEIAAVGHVVYEVDTVSGHPNVTIGPFVVAPQTTWV